MSDGFGIFGAVKGLFEYNRENFIFDRTMNQERVYQTQKMRVAQVKLYRDDLRDLFDLTIRKMDSYLIFNALLLLFVGGLFYEGRLPQGTPAWLLWLWTMSVGSAYFFLSLSIWFAIHASITAQTFQVRLLTQWLRLPIPSAEVIHAVAGAVTDFEKTRARDMLRVPGVANKEDVFSCVEKFPDVPNTLLKSDLVHDYTLFVEHFYLFRDLQKHWQGFDAYARIGMVVGTNMLMSAFSYMSLAYFLMSYKNVSGFIFPLILTAFQLIHIRINLRDLSLMEGAAICVLLGFPPFLAAIAGFHAVLESNTFFGDILSPVMFACSGGWIVFLVLLGSEDDGGLPNRFVTVGSIDVLGLEADEAKFDALSPEKGNENNEDDNFSISSTGGGSDTPVAVCVPPAQVVRKAEERRRSRSFVELNENSSKSETGGGTHNLTLNSEIRYFPNIGPREETIAEEIPLESILESFTKQSSVEDIGEKTEEPSTGFKAYESAAKAKLLPWKTFRQAGSVLVCLWIFATCYSVLASFTPRWGWPRTAPHGDGEESTSPRRLIVVSSKNFIFDDESDYGKVNILDHENNMVFSFDSFGVDSYRIEQDTDVLHITYGTSGERSFHIASA